MKGELQVSEKERELMMDKTFRDIATIVAEKCVDPQTNRPLTVGLVERAMKDIHYSVNATKNAKQQALDVIKLLQQSGKIPIARAKMRLKLTMTKTESEKLATQWKDIIAQIEKQETTENKFIMVFIFFFFFFFCFSFWSTKKKKKKNGRFVKFNRKTSEKLMIS
jgi:ribosome maturation protein SDO1